MSSITKRGLTFTKQDVIKRVSEKLDIPITSLRAPVDAVFTVLREIMSEDYRSLRIEIRDFDVFEVKPTKAKPKARNPKTNEEVMVPARKKAVFKVSRELNNILN